MRHLLVAVCAVAGAAAPCLAAPFYITSMREVSQLPRPSNNGQVVGHDNGSSVLFNGTSYWFFADTLLDVNGNDGLDGGDTGLGSFIGRGTVATTTDLEAIDGMTLTYRASGGRAQPLYPPAALFPGECLLWPAGAVVANSKIYVYGNAVKGSGPSCGSLGSDTFLATLNTTTLEATRLATSWPSTMPSFANPLAITDTDGSRWVYLVGAKVIDSWTKNYQLSRVREADIENPARYEYWSGGATWSPNNPAAAQTIFSDALTGAQTSLAYNTALDRYLITYSCGASTQVCARTALVGGRAPTALRSGWSPPSALYTCPGEVLNCYAAYQHPEYAKAKAIYITTARNTPFIFKCDGEEDCVCPNDNCDIPAGGSSGTCTTPPNIARRYSMRLRQVKLSATAPANAPEFIDAGVDYSPKTCTSTATQGYRDWFYRQLAGSTFSNMTFSSLWNWRGTESIGGFPAPLMDEDSASPGNSTDAVRVWQPPAGKVGNVQISGELRKRYSCGDDAIGEVVRIRNGLQVATLWSATLNPSTRAAIYNISTPLASGDAIGFKVKHGGAAASCDNLVFSPLIEFTP